MIETIYIERDIAEHPRTLQTRKRFPRARTIACERWGEIFNRRAQNFRLQKLKPALILARKHGELVLPAPPAYGIGGKYNYYFSHLLNCLYDCRYCFLQGMFRSAHYVSFVNLEDFENQIRSRADEHADEPQEAYFFSGYDCDSLALEPVTGFLDFVLPLFESMPHAWLELRTKSTQIRELLARDPLANCVVAFSVSPPAIARRWEHRAPGFEARLEAARKLQLAGWPIGLRFDPVIDVEDAAMHYEQCLEQVFTTLNSERIHSVSIGSLRLPEAFHKRIDALYPGEDLLAGLNRDEGGMMAYPASRDRNLRETLAARIGQFMPKERVFQCA